MRRSVPEVTQTSAMDCGPAVLSSILTGLGASVSYPRLREACQTDVDGTSIDTLEELANRFGFAAEQVMLPGDFVFAADAGNLPCIAVVRLPNGLTHFVAVWRTLFGFVQIMDPARGRSWMRTERFLDTLYQHRMRVPAEDWLEYAGSDEFRGYLHTGLEALGIRDDVAADLLARTSDADHWQPIAQLDAAIRMCRAIRRTSGSRGVDAQALLVSLIDTPELLAEEYFQVVCAGAGELELRGAILVRFTGQADGADLRDPVVAHASQPPEKSVLSGLLEVARSFGAARVAVGLAFVSFLISLVTFVEALVFRYLIGAQPPADLPMLALMAFVVIAPLLAAVALETGGRRLSQNLGRSLAMSMHAKLLRKLPRMADGYFSSRLLSDLAERGHAVSQIREVPELFRQLMITGGRITFVLAGLVWLLPAQWPLILTAAIVALIAPLAMYPMLVERDLRARTHLGALSRFYLDSLRGTEAIGAHGAARSMHNEQESLLLGWARAIAEQQRPSILFEGLQVLLLTAVSITLVHTSLASISSLGTILLVAYWSLFVPVLSLQLTQALRQIPSFANVARRVLELLDAPEEDVDADESAPAQQGVRLEFEKAGVRRGEIPLIEDITLSVEAGERIAIVGASGSGKSSFLSTLTGWNPLNSGDLRVDGRPLTPAGAAQLREQTVLIDADLYLWNRSLHDNIRYGLEELDSAASETALSESGLLGDLSRMSEGLATRIGENGSRLSGGERQRLRIARGMVRSHARLVLLDEPFTGLDPAGRLRVRRAIEARWPQATLLFVSHNVEETRHFPRVLVFRHGRLVEDGAPASLLATPDSVYGEMLEKESDLERHLREDGRWRHHWLQAGQLAAS